MTKEEYIVRLSKYPLRISGKKFMCCYCNKLILPGEFFHGYKGSPRKIHETCCRKFFECSGLEYLPINMVKQVKKKLIEIYIPSDPNEIIDSKHGIVKYKDFLEKELAWFIKCGRQAEIKVRATDNFIYMVANDISEV